ncbi:MAG: NTP transferase domain-containing protein, partial [Anaerolineales bacterium]|nr:NTP transferase domain-containing protein [Anaerolineales bacterium]
SQTPAALIALGDQPQIQAGTVQALIAAYQQSQVPLIVPSYQMRRGHPWLVGREYWTELLALLPPLTLRDFLARHAAEIHYLPLDHPGVIQDIDTPEQYAQSRPE